MNANEIRLRVAKRNPYNSITRVVLQKPVNKKYFGVKDTKQIPQSLISKLESTQCYVHHTCDAYAWGGRAIDINIKHPVTGSFMSGSSSGSAVNVFCGINDLGIGSDGGGSVLAPAMCLNLFAFISPLIEQKEMKEFVKKSTDGIDFTPSIGFITKSLSELVEVIQHVLIINLSNTEKITVLSNLEDTSIYPFSTNKKQFPNIFGQREGLIRFLSAELKNYDVVISKEGPIDIDGIGDSVFGSFGTFAQKMQQQSKKGLLRVVNMAGASAICIPSTEFTSGYVLICESNIDKISKMIQLAHLFHYERPQVVERYFNNLMMYEE